MLNVGSQAARLWSVGVPQHVRPSDCVLNVGPPSLSLNLGSNRVARLRRPGPLSIDPEDARLGSWGNLTVSLSLSSNCAIDGQVALKVPGSSLPKVHFAANVGSACSRQGTLIEPGSSVVTVEFAGSPGYAENCRFQEPGSNVAGVGYAGYLCCARMFRSRHGTGGKPDLNVTREGGAGALGIARRMRSPGQVLLVGLEVV
jgi:hypothetical protein